MITIQSCLEFIGLMAVFFGIFLYLSIVITTLHSLDVKTNYIKELLENSSLNEDNTEEKRDEN